MNNIYKYLIGGYTQTLEVQGFVRILTVQVTQGEQAFIWIESINEDNCITEVTIRHYPTGQEVKLSDHREMYVGSLFYRDGHYIEHVYVTLQ